MPYALDPYRAAPAQATDRTGCQKIRSGRRIAFDINFAGAFEARCTRHRKRRPAVARHIHAEAPHHVERDIDVRLGHEFAFDLHHRARAEQRQAHQQCGQELARNVAAHLHLDARAYFARVNRQRRITRRAEISDVGTEAGKRVDEVLDRAFVHARDS